MAATKGKTLLIKKGATLLAGIRSKTVTINNNPIDVTTDDDVNAAGASYRAYLAGIVDLEITGEGVAKDATAARAMRKDAIAGTVAEYTIEFPGGDTLVGDMFIASYIDTGVVEGAVTFSITLRNSEAPTYNDAA